MAKDKKNSKHIPDDIRNDFVPPKMYIWEKLTGKYYPHNGERVIAGETYQAPKGYFADDTTWRCLGPVNGVEENLTPSITSSVATLRKVFVSDGKYDIIKKDGSKINDEPISEEEADKIVNAPMDDK